MTKKANTLWFNAWIEAVQLIAKHYRMDVSAEQLQLVTQWQREQGLDYLLQHVAREAGLYAKYIDLDYSDLNECRLPIVVQFSDGQVAVLEQINTSGKLGLRYCGDRGLMSEINKQELMAQVKIAFIMRPIRATWDGRVDNFIQPYKENWLRQAILGDWRLYSHLFIASFLINVLGLAGILFTRQVYDRVIPAESYPTLYVLFIGVLIAFGFVFVFSILRAKVVDMMGKRADLRISDRVYGHVLRIKNSDRPQSTGTLIAQVRELENIRELMTSTVLTAIADIPFFLLFCLVFWMFAGDLVWIPIVAVILMVVPGFLAQPALKKYANMNLREGSLRNAILIEAIQGIEDIKVTQSEQRFQNEWNSYNAATADVSLKLRSLTTWLNSWTNVVQRSVFVLVVMAGAFRVIEGDLTTGTLIAASLLSMRMLAPMAKVAMVLTRVQQAKVAYTSINKILELPLDGQQGELGRVHIPNIKGNFNFKNASYTYQSEQTKPVLTVNDLQINQGEKIALLGRNGAGKSTLLQALSGLLLPISGEATLENINMVHIDSADLRRDVSLLSQNSKLFYGTLRENVTLGNPIATEQEIMEALKMVGAFNFVQRLPLGLDSIVNEGGAGLSGGQKQALLLCRIILRDSHVLLLDEPTSAMDDQTEHFFINRLSKWGSHKTIIIATHKMRVLDVVDRIIVVGNGRVILDGDKEVVLDKLQQRGNHIPRRKGNG